MTVHGTKEGWNRTSTAGWLVTHSPRAKRGRFGSLGVVENTGGSSTQRNQKKYVGYV